MKTQNITKMLLLNTLDICLRIKNFHCYEMYDYFPTNVKFKGILVSNLLHMQPDGTLYYTLTHMYHF